MSTALAVAATSRVIASLIDDNVQAVQKTLPTLGNLGSNNTTSAPPDHIVTSPRESEELVLNLFLYHVTYNQGWREVGLPTRNGNGDVVGKSPLSIDLHYLLSAYGPDDYSPQILLGVGMQALHELPFLYREKIRQVFSAPSTDVDKALATAELDAQIEMIKVVPQQIGTEELSKLWTAFQSKFRVSAGYVVTVVLIETKNAVTAALPVRRRHVTAVPYLEPTIDAVIPNAIAYAPGAMLTIAGENLPGANTLVQFAAATTPSTPSVVQQGAALSVALPALPAGVNLLNVIRLVDIGTSPLRPLVASNNASFILQPVIQSITLGAADPTVIPPPGRQVTLTLDPPLLATQRVSLLLNELGAAPGTTPRSYQFDADPSGVQPPNTAVIETRGVASGVTYLVRVRVDGADSPLKLNPVTQAYTAPTAAF